MVIKWLTFSVATIGLAGCASESESTTKPSSVSERQDAALRDPFGYSPTLTDPKKAEEAAKQKKKDDGSLKSDWEKFWNP